MLGCLMTYHKLNALDDDPTNDPGSDEDDSSDDDSSGDAQDEEENDVRILTADNFQDFLKDNEVSLVMFYAPWCGHCKSLKPAFEAAAKVLKSAKNPVILGKVDATVETTLGSDYSISGYPTLFIFKSGQKLEYDGPRDEAGIIKYMEERADPSWKPPPDAVITLTSTDFDEITNREPLMLVEFYAPWCGHCKKLEPEYEKAAKQLQNEDPPILLAKVDATQESDLASRFGVTGYPTLKIFRKGKVSDYKGERNTMGIVKHMVSQVGEASILSTSQKDLQKLLEENNEEIVVVGYFTDEENNLALKYIDATNNMREEYVFTHTFDSKIAEAFKVKQNTIIIYAASLFHTTFEKKKYVFDKEDAEESDIVSFVKIHDTPLVGEYNTQTKEKQYKQKRPLVIFFYTVDFTFENRKATQLWRNKIAAIANKHPELTFAIADDVKMATDFSSFGFDDSGEEMNVGIYDDKNRKYAMEEMEEFDVDQIEEFLKKYNKGSLKPKLKSQPIPKKQSGPVTVVVGKNFDKIVNDAKKDVFIEFYAPWCGHCKSLEPKYKKLAKKFKDKNTVIAKMDATANDVPPPFEVSGFPTIYFVPANDKNNPKKYEGGREVDDMEQYLKTQSSENKSKDEL